MASVCPNCGKKLHFYNVKAECSQCGVSIPNFNWEKRLEEDNANAEKKFQSFYRFGNRFAYSIWGTKLRIVRIILSFLPAVGFLLPWATLKSDAGSVGLDLFGMTCDTSLIDLFKDFFANSGVYFANMGYENYAGTLFYTMLALVFMLLSAIFIIVAFFMILLCKFRRYWLICTIMFNSFRHMHIPAQLFSPLRPPDGASGVAFRRSPPPQWQRPFREIRRIGRSLPEKEGSFPFPRAAPAGRKGPAGQAKTRSPRNRCNKKRGVQAPHDSS